jgi:hypothetical protein
MPTEIIGSRMPDFASEQSQVSTRGYGQNGSPTPSSLTPGQARKVSKTYASLATDTPNINSETASNVQMRTISAKALKPSPTMKNPNASPTKIPTSLSYGGSVVRPSSVPARRGNAKR